MNKKKYFHAINIIQENCNGCSNCVRICPSEAIRLRNSKIIIDETRCIDCGKCIQVCPSMALTPISDKLKEIENFDYNIAIISAPFAGQFPHEIGFQRAKNTLFELGFDEVADEAEVSEVIAKMIREYIQKNPKKRPVISSDCPVVVRLIQLRFPSLLPNILHLEAPMSVITKYYRDKIIREKKIDPSLVGIFLIVPCIAQVTAVHQPEGSYKRFQDGAISMNEIFNKIVALNIDIEPEENEIDFASRGHTWAISGLEAEDVNNGEIKTLAVSGINNVVEVLSRMENHQLENYDYIVLGSCTNGCVGGVLNPENPFIATSRIKRLMKNRNQVKIEALKTTNNLDEDYFLKLFRNGLFDVPNLEPRSIMELDKNIRRAITKMKKMQEITDLLPGLNCCACGSPTCQALAEDIVQGKATLDDCLIRIRQEKQKN